MKKRTTPIRRQFGDGVELRVKLAGAPEGTVVEWDRLTLGQAVALANAYLSEGAVITTYGVQSGRTRDGR